jgi:hypothetical protein
LKNQEKQHSSAHGALTTGNAPKKKNVVFVRKTTNTCNSIKTMNKKDLFKKLPEKKKKNVRNVLIYIYKDGCANSHMWESVVKKLSFA